MTNPCRRLGLGTAQLGMHYGITNTAGMPNTVEANNIVRYAQANGIRIFDTAHDYGGGEAERRLGRWLSRDCGGIITKIPPLPRPVTEKQAAAHVRTSFAESLRRLRRKKIYALLAHRAQDLLAAEKARAIYSEMNRLRAAGKVQKIGVSVYSAEEIEKITNTFDIDLIQLPLSIVDQRLLRSGHLAALREKNIEIHARSVFLQGLLLTTTDDFPPRVNGFKNLFSDYHAFLSERELSPLQATLGFVLSIREVDYAVVGAARVEDLREIVAACRVLPTNTADLGHLAINDAGVLDPSLWPRS